MNTQPDISSARGRHPRRMDFSFAHRRRQDRSEAPKVLEELIAPANIRFNGTRPWDIRVSDPRLYGRILRQGSLGFGESFMDGDWDCERLDDLFCRLFRARIDRHIHGVARLRFLGTYLRTVMMNRQSRRRSFQVGQHHYDIGNDVYEAMLDSSMSYSCGYWKDADDLETAQNAKLDLICRKLELEPGQRLLDIGCGWGGLAEFAARHYGVEVLGVTVSRKQRELAIERCAGLPVSIDLKDYRSIQGRFDRVVSVGMFEHVGPRNYPQYFATIHRVLEPEGLCLLHTIGHHQTTSTTDEWIERYIFPNSKLPSARQVTTALESHFIIEDWHNFGQDYDPTLMAWWANFDAAWARLKTRYGERFYRMWKYYLLSCAGFFRSRQGALWQLVLTSRQRRRGYRSIR